VQRFNQEELRLVENVTAEAQSLVTRYYALSPREWARMRYEVKTQVESEPTELLDSVLAHVVCYEYTRRLGSEVLESGELYRICLQDNRILDTHAHQGLKLSDLLVYVLTHELIHVVRFGQRLQRLDLAAEERPMEERSVDIITSKILGFCLNSSCH
jgi:predicted Zn-dependent protease with MMP-like domain